MYIQIYVLCIFKSIFAYIYHSYLYTVYIYIYTWNPNDLYFWRSTAQNRAFPKQSKGHQRVPGVYMCIYIYKCIYMYIYICIYMYIYIYIYLCMLNMSSIPIPLSSLSFIPTMDSPSFEKTQVVADWLHGVRHGGVSWFRWPRRGRGGPCEGTRDDVSGQIIATSHDLTPNGGLVREIPLFQGHLGWWNIIIWPDVCIFRS